MNLISDIENGKAHKITLSELADTLAEGETVYITDAHYLFPITRLADDGNGTGARGVDPDGAEFGTGTCHIPDVAAYYGERPSVCFFVAYRLPTWPNAGWGDFACANCGHRTNAVFFYAPEFRLCYECSVDLTPDDFCLVVSWWAD